MEKKDLKRYWVENKVLITILLVIWAVVSYGFSILLGRALNGVHVGSVPMSFWWAQQGSMFVFVLLIFIYAWRMDALDKKYDVHDDAGKPGRR